MKAASPEKVSALRAGSVAPSLLVLPEVAAVYEMIAACGEDVRTRLDMGPHVPCYPREFLEEQTSRGRLHAVWDAGTPVATVMIFEGPPPGMPFPWPAEDARALYIDKIAVHPRWQGRGLGTLLLRWVEATAQRRGFGAVRLAVVRRDQRAMTFFRNRGYREQGEALTRDPRGRLWDSVLFEKQVEARKVA